MVAAALRPPHHPVAIPPAWSDDAGMGGIVGGQAAAAQRHASRATGRLGAGGLRGWRMTLLAIALAVGITVGWRQAEPRVWMWLAVAAAAAVCGAAAGAAR